MADAERERLFYVALITKLMNGTGCRTAGHPALNVEMVTKTCMEVEHTFTTNNACVRQLTTEMKRFFRKVTVVKSKRRENKRSLPVEGDEIETFRTGTDESGSQQEPNRASFDQGDKTSPVHSANLTSDKRMKVVRNSTAFSETAVHSANPTSDKRLKIVRNTTAPIAAAEGKHADEPNENGHTEKDETETSSNSSHSLIQSTAMQSKKEKWFTEDYEIMMRRCKSGVHDPRTDSYLDEQLPKHFDSETSACRDVLQTFLRTRQIKIYLQDTIVGQTESSFCFKMSVTCVVRIEKNLFASEAANKLSESIATAENSSNEGSSVVLDANASSEADGSIQIMNALIQIAEEAKKDKGLPVLWNIMCCPYFLAYMSGFDYTTTMRHVSKCAQRNDEIISSMDTVKRFQDGLISLPVTGNKKKQKPLITKQTYLDGLMKHLQNEGVLKSDMKTMVSFIRSTDKEMWELPLVAIEFLQGFWVPIYFTSFSQFFKCVKGMRMVKVKGIISYRRLGNERDVRRDDH